jgi:hypothetical protein
MLGVLLILASTLAYNGSAVLLATAARELGRLQHHPHGQPSSPRFARYLTEPPGLGPRGRRARPYLPDAGPNPERRRAGHLAGADAVGPEGTFRPPRTLRGRVCRARVVAVGFAPPSFGNTAPPELEGWALLLVVLMPGVVLPYVLRALGRRALAWERCRRAWLTPWAGFSIKASPTPSTPRGYCPSCHLRPLSWSAFWVSLPSWGLCGTASYRSWYR